MPFDITSVLQTMTAAETEDRLEMIELHMLDKNPKNFYSVAGIEELADSIRMSGLLTPLRVKRTEFGRFMIISGHRRREAMWKLAMDPEATGWGVHRKIPCIVEPEKTRVDGIEDPEAEAKAGPLMEELRLIFANSDTRQMTSADTATQVRRLREILTELKALGANLPGKLRDHVAAAAGVSATRVARLDVIDKGLTEPSLRKAWKDGTLGETAAYEIARRSEAAQHSAALSTGVKALRQMTTEQINVAMDHYEQRAEEARKAREEWNRNVGTMAEATETEPKFDGHGHLEFDAEEYLMQRQRDDDEFVQALDDFADMFFREMDYVTDRREGIEHLKRVFGSVRRGGNAAAGILYDCAPKGLTISGKHERITRTWTEVFDILACAALRNMARRKVSAADTIILKTGTPTEPGEYMTRAGVGNEDTKQTTMWQRLEWHDGRWCFPKTGAPMPKGTTVFSWFKLPEI